MLCNEVSIAKVKQPYTGTAGHPQTMGKRGFGSKRRTVLQLDDSETRKQPTYGLGYRAADEPDCSRTTAEAGGNNPNALSGLMSVYAQDSNSDEDSDEQEAAEHSVTVAHFDATTVDSRIAAASSKHSSSSSIPWQRFVAATDTAPPPPPPPDAAPPPPLASENSSKSSSGRTTMTEAPPPPSDDIDLKLQDFLAEIESIEVPKELTMVEESIDGVPILDGVDAMIAMPDEPTVVVKQHREVPAAEIPDGGSDGEEEEWKETPPKEPTTTWQQCLDEETQCYYYWNYDSNEVTWEIPAEYSQYLLQYQEHEQALARYELERAEWKKKVASRRRHRLHKKKSKRLSKKPATDNNDEICIPIVSYPPPGEGSDEEDAGDKPPLPPVAEAVPSVYGPFLPTAMPAEPASMDSQGNVAEAPLPPPLPTDPPPPPIPDAPTSSSGQLEDEGRVEAAEVETTAGERDYDVVEKLRLLHQKFMQRSGRAAKAAETAAMVGETEAATIHPDGNNAIGPLEAGEVLKDDTVRTSVGGKVDKNREEGVSGADLTAVEEPPAFVRFEFVNRRYDSEEQSTGGMNGVEERTGGGGGGSEDGDEELELDIEDIDKELEMALEQKQRRAVQPTAIKELASAVLPVVGSCRPSNYGSSNVGKATGSRAEKRKAVEEPIDDLPSVLQSKRIKQDESESAEMSSKHISAEDIRIKMNELAEISELSSMITDKLEFLEVTHAGLSKLQVLLLQIETRVEDWRVGALRTEHLLDKLRESCATLAQYECGATPAGWSCHWHRTYRRYFYSHDMTGATRWDYPDADTDLPEPMAAGLSDHHLHHPPEVICSLDPSSLPIDRRSKADSEAGEEEDEKEQETTVEVRPTDSFAEPANTMTYSAPLVVYPGEPIPPGIDETPTFVPASTLDLVTTLVDNNGELMCPPPPPPLDETSPAIPPLEDNDTNGAVADENQRMTEVDSEAVQTSVTGVQEEEEEKREEQEVRVEALLPGVISAPPLLNRPPLNTAADVHGAIGATHAATGSTQGAAGYTHGATSYALLTDSVKSPTPSAASSADDRDIASPCSSDMAVVASTSVEGHTPQHGKEHAGGVKRKKEKQQQSLVASGLSLKKKNLSSLVEKWQKVQKDVTDEVSKEELKKMKKATAASGGTGGGTGGNLHHE